MKNIHHYLWGEVYHGIPMAREKVLFNVFTLNGRWEPELEYEQNLRVESLFHVVVNATLFALIDIDPTRKEHPWP